MLTPPTLAEIRRKLPDLPVEASDKTNKCKWSQWWSLDTPNDIVRAHKIPCHENSYINRLLRIDNP